MSAWDAKDFLYDNKKSGSKEKKERTTKRSKVAANNLQAIDYKKFISQQKQSHRIASSPDLCRLAVSNKSEIRSATDQNP